MDKGEAKICETGQVLLKGSHTGKNQPEADLLRTLNCLAGAVLGEFELVKFPLLHYRCSAPLESEVNEPRIQ